MTNHKTAYQHAMEIADHIDEVGESPYELVKQLHTAGLITPDSREDCITRRTYDLPAPTAETRCGAFSAWDTGHSIEIDGDIDNDGAITHNRDLGTIDIETHEGEALELDYDEARRVALALLAAVEEGETTKEDN